MSGRNRPKKSTTVPVALVLLAEVGGVLALTIGSMIYSGASEDRARHAFVSGLPDLLSAPRGERSILEGRISGTVRPIREEFVAYLREQYRSSTARTSRWVSLGGEVPPLTIETATGVVRVVNTDYAFDRAIPVGTIPVCTYRPRQT